MAGQKYIRQIRAIMAHQGIDEESKAAMCLSVSNGDTASLRELTDAQAITIIRQLNGQPDTPPPPGKAQAMRRKIIALCHEMGWKNTDGTINMTRVNAYCTQRGYLKKPLNDYTTRELPKLVTQFENLHKSFISKR